MKVQVQITIDPELLKEAKEKIKFREFSSTIERLLKKELKLRGRQNEKKLNKAQSSDR